MIRETDYLFRITSYIKSNLRKGYTMESLKIALIKQGYSKTSIENAIKMVEKDMAAAAPILPKEPERPVVMEPITPPRRSFWQRLFG